MTDLQSTLRFTHLGYAIPLMGVLFLGACDISAKAREAPTVPTRNTAQETVTLRIKPRGVYYLNGSRDSVPVSQLARRLGERYSTREQGRTLVLLAYKGTSGYDIAIATNAAREAGVTDVLGTADYSEGDEDRISFREPPKRWRSILPPLKGPMRVSRDTVALQRR